MEDLFPFAFSDNEHERAILSKYLDGRNMTAGDLFNEILKFRHGTPGLPRPLWQGPVLREGDKPAYGEDDVVCHRCAVGLFEASLADWWMAQLKDPQVQSMLRISSVVYP